MLSYNDWDPKVEDKGKSYPMLAHMDSYLSQHVKGSLTKLSYREQEMRAMSWSQFLDWVTRRSIIKEENNKHPIGNMHWERVVISISKLSDSSINN